MHSQKDSVLALHMGSGFNRLSTLLQKAHLGKNKLEGIAQVKRGNMLARIICGIFSFPNESDKVRLRVECDHTKESMIWRRDFDGLKMVSHFRRSGDYLVEHLGGLAMSFKAIESEGKLQYQFVKTRFFGIPMPNFLSPQVKASEWEENGHYQFSVEVTMFLVGLVISYGGELKVESTV